MHNVFLASKKVGLFVYMSSITVCRTHYPSKIFLATGSPYHVYYFHRVFSINTLNPWWDNDIIVIIFGIDTLSVYSYLVPRRGALLGFFNQAQQLLLMSAVRCYKCNGSSIEVFGLLLQKVSTQFTIWKIFRPSLFVPIYVILFTNFGSQKGSFAVQRFFFLFVGQGFCSS